MILERVVGSFICGFVQLITAAKVSWPSVGSSKQQRIYYANHRSHADVVLLWSSLPTHIRYQTKPVAGADYWLTNGLKRYLSKNVFGSVLIDRQKSEGAPNPVEQMIAALDKGDSLIIFPEGTRNLEEGVKSFKSGIFHLAQAHPDVEFIPVWLENMGRVMPKGAIVPVPLICTLSFGEPLYLKAEEGKEDFLRRARQALLDLEPAHKMERLS